MKNKILAGLFYLGGLTLVVLAAYSIEQVTILAIYGDKSAYAVAPSSDKPNFDQYSGGPK